MKTNTDVNRDVIEVDPPQRESERGYDVLEVDDRHGFLEVDVLEIDLKPIEVTPM